MILLLKQAVILIGSLIGAYTDFKTGYIYDKITYPMIAIGILLNLFELGKEISFENFMSLFSVGIIVFVLGYGMYWLGKIGGGDVKIFTAIALLIPFEEGIFPLNIFVLNALIWAGIASLVFYGVYYVIKYARKGINWKENQEGIKKAAGLGILILFYFFMIYSFGLGKLILVLLIPLSISLVFIALEKGIKKEFFLKKISLQEMEEDEVIAVEFTPKETLEKLKLGFKGVLG
ncbi:prepilin peptidase, partial [Candidatus Micrarchaeota archaeon]|nr:prepilin peptidase [Candidatus Micrarchaeota archaeon]